MSADFKDCVQELRLLYKSRIRCRTSYTKNKQTNKDYRKTNTIKNTIEKKASSFGKVLRKDRWFE